MANLCLLRGGEVWQVRGAKIDALNATLFSLLPVAKRTAVKLITAAFYYELPTADWLGTGR